MRAVPGTVTIATVAGIVAVHELLALMYAPDELITRVIARWRSKHRLPVDAVIIYLAGHLIDAWPNDPLTVRER